MKEYTKPRQLERNDFVHDITPYLAIALARYIDEQQDFLDGFKDSPNFNTEVGLEELKEYQDAFDHLFGVLSQTSEFINKLNKVMENLVDEYIDPDTQMFQEISKSIKCYVKPDGVMYREADIDDLEFMEFRYDLYHIHFLVNRVNNDLLCNDPVPYELDFVDCDVIGSRIMQYNYPNVDKEEMELHDKYQKELNQLIRTRTNLANKCLTRMLTLVWKDKDPKIIDFLVENLYGLWT